MTNATVSSLTSHTCLEVKRSDSAPLTMINPRSRRFSSNPHNLPLVTIHAVFVFHLSFWETDCSCKDKNVLPQNTTLTSERWPELNIWGGKKQLIFCFTAASKIPFFFFFFAKYVDIKDVSTSEVINEVFFSNESLGTFDCSLRSIKEKANHSTSQPLRFKPLRDGEIP